MDRMRILITEGCNANCKSCFNKDYRTAKYINFDDYKDLAVYLKNSGVKLVKIMGGEPTTHPDFLKIVDFSKKCFEKIGIFTNGINDEISKIALREGDGIVYNATFINAYTNLEKLLLDQPGERSFEVQIRSDMNIYSFINDMDALLTNVEKKIGYEESCKKIMINFTLNCMENIFKYKNSITENWNKLYEYFHDKRKYRLFIDHNIPYCFLVNSNMKIFDKIFNCRVKDAGLIDSNLNLRYCNQFSKVLTPMKENGEWISIKKIENYLFMGYNEKIGVSLNKICKDCSIFNTKCNGGCFMHKDFIRSEDVQKSINWSPGETKKYVVKV